MVKICNAGQSRHKLYKNADNNKIRKFIKLLSFPSENYGFSSNFSNSLHFIEFK